MQIRVITFLLAAVLLCGTAASTTLYVNETGWHRSGDAFNTTGTPIQHAIGNATSGDMVYLWNGSYVENVYISNSHLTLEGESKNVVSVPGLSITAGGDDVVVSHISFDEMSAQTVDNLTFTHNEMTEPMMALTTVTNSFFNDNIFRGIIMVNANTDNTFTANTYHQGFNLYGIRLGTSSNCNNTFTESDFRGNVKESGYPAIAYAGGSNNTFTDPIFEYPTAVLHFTVGNDVKFIRNDRKIFAPMGGYWDWHYSGDGNHWYDWAEHSISGLNVTIDGSQSTMHVTDTVTASTGTVVCFSAPHFFVNPSTGSFNVTDIIWNTTSHGWFFAADDHYSNDTATRGKKTFNVTATDPAATGSIQCGDFGRGTPIQMFVNSIDNGTVTATTAGIAAFSYTSGFSGKMYFDISTYNKTGTTLFHDVFNTVYSSGGVEYSDWVIGSDAINTTIVPGTGSVEISINQSIINADYRNTNLYDLNITELDGTLVLKDDDITTMVITPTNIFNIWDIEYYINATSNRKAAAFKTFTTNATNLINFTFHDLYPSANFDCKYDSVSFTTNTSGSTGTLEFNKSAWTANVTRTVDIFMTTTPYRCAAGRCWIYEGDAMVVYLDLNDSTVQSVQASVTTPSGSTSNMTLIDFIDDGMISWRLDYEDTGVKGTYTIDNFYRNRGSGWEALDSFLEFESRVASSGGSPVPPATPDEPDDGDDGGGGGGAAQPEPLPESGVAPDKESIGICIDGVAMFDNSIVLTVESWGCSRVEVRDYYVNPVAISLVGGERWGYADILVEDGSGGGKVTFQIPEGADSGVAIYQLVDGVEWIELQSTRIDDTMTINVDHFSLFGMAEPDMTSVIESLTELSFSPPKVSGILMWTATSDEYTSIHIANRQLASVSSSEKIICEILTTGDYPNRTLQCTYTPQESTESTFKFKGEIVAIDTNGYTRRIPVEIMVYNMRKLAFPMVFLIVLLGGILLYRR